MNAKLVSKGLVFAIIFVLAMSVASSSFAKGRGNSPESSEGWFVVSFVGMTPNDDDTSTWTYSVEETGEGKDLSHWALALECTPNGDRHTVVDANPKPYEVGINPHTGVYSIKWDVSDDFVSGEFSVTVEGVWEIDEVKFATKAGRSIGKDYIDGPTCVEQDDGGGDPGGGV